MKALNATLSEILIDVSSDRRFQAPENAKRIEANAKKLTTLAHEIRKMPDNDPSVPMIGSLFADESKRAYEALKTGHRDYARSLLRTVSGYCIGCHTQSPSKTDTKAAAMSPELKKLSPIERGEFLAATRQNDAALAEFEKIVASSDVRGMDLEKATRYAMAIAIRVKQDPEKTLAVIENVLGAKNAPLFLKEDAAAWKKSAEEWKKEKQPTSKKSEEALYEEAVRLMSLARSTQKFPMDRSADIIYLRMTSVVHDLLRSYPESKHSADALFLLGLSYEVLHDLNLWTLHEMYYESCIKKAPHTSTAQGCYRQYEKTIYSGYSGSGGVSLPKDVLKKLGTLETLAKDAPAKPQ